MNESFIPDITYSMDEYYKLKRARYEIDRTIRILHFDDKEDVSVKIPCDNNGNNHYINKLLSILQYEQVTNPMYVEFVVHLDNPCEVKMHVVYHCGKRQTYLDLKSFNDIRNIFYCIFYYPYIDIKDGLHGCQLSLFEQHIDKYK